MTFFFCVDHGEWKTACLIYCQCCSAQSGGQNCLQRQASSVRDLLSPHGRSKLDNLGLMTALLDLNVMTVLSPNAGIHSSQCNTECKLFTILRRIDIATVYNRTMYIGWQAKTTITSKEYTKKIQYTVTTRTEATPTTHMLRLVRAGQT